MGNGTGDRDARELLSRFGVSMVQITMAIPFLFFMPASSDSASQGVMAIIRAIQRGLNQTGLLKKPLTVDGILGERTAAAINLVSPPAGSFLHKQWIVVLQDVNDAMLEAKKPKPKPTSTEPPGARPPETGLVAKLSSLHPGVIVGGVFLGLYLLFGSKKKRRRS